MEKNNEISRRETLKGLAAVVGAAAATALTGSNAFAQGGKEAAPSDLGSIQKIEGEASLNGKPAGAGQKFHFGDLLRVGPKSAVWIVYENSAVSKIKELSSLTFSRNPENPKKGVALSLESGSVLSYVHKLKTDPYRFEVRTPTATAGVRGTTFFVKRLSPDKTYVCDCFGDVEIVSPKHEGQSKMVKAERHTAYTVGSEGDSLDSSLEKAGLIDHTDEEIDEMKSVFAKATGLKPAVEFQPKKDDDFLEGYGF